MPLLPLTSPRPDVGVGGKAPADAPHTEVTLGNEWVGDFTDLDGVGVTFTAGWDGAVLYLVHGQVYEGGSPTPTLHDNLLGGTEPYRMAPLERRHFGPLPQGSGAVTIQYDCPHGSLHVLFEYSPKG
jgi:hypothetical protein